MMIWNNHNFNFPCNYSMELIYVLMDYTLMFLIFVSLVIFLIILNEFIFSNMFKMKFVNNSMILSHELELVWSVLPFFILLFIFLPTLKTLYFLDSCEYCGLVIKVMGFQWYWSYSSDMMNSIFNSYMNNEAFSMRLMEVDNSLVLPANIPMRFMITSNDVIHSWTIPSAGVKADAIPGRINQLCFNMNKVGKFFGQCSEICGANHSFMPINLEMVNSNDYFKILN